MRRAASGVGEPCCKLQKQLSVLQLQLLGACIRRSDVLAAMERLLGAVRQLLFHRIGSSDNLHGLRVLAHRRRLARKRVLDRSSFAVALNA